jgi:hypothetical protein
VTADGLKTQCYQLLEELSGLSSQKIRPLWEKVRPTIDFKILGASGHEINKFLYKFEHNTFMNLSSYLSFERKRRGT